MDNNSGGFSGSLDRFFGSKPPAPVPEQSGFAAPDPEKEQGSLAKMFGAGAPELREEMIQKQQAEIDQSNKDKAAAEDLHKDTLVRESHMELASNPATRESVKRVTEDMVGAAPGELSIPGEDGKTAMDKMNQLTRFLSLKSQAEQGGMTGELQRDMDLLDQEIAWLSKDKKDMSKQELMGVGLIAALPALIGMMAGGKKGLMHGIAAGLSGAGQQLQGQSEEDRVASIIELQRLKGQKQGLFLDAEKQAAEISGIDPASLQKFELAQQLGLEVEELNGLSEKQMETVTTFGAGVQSLGYEVENPKALAGLTQTEIPKAREALSALENLELNLDAMLKIAETKGGAFAVGNTITGEVYASPDAVDLNMLQADGLATVRFFQQAGANLTGVEVVLGESLIPDLTGWQSAFEQGKAVKRVRNAKMLLAKQKAIMMKRYGIASTKMSQDERARLEELESRAIEDEGGE